MRLAALPAAFAFLGLAAVGAADARAAPAPILVTYENAGVLNTSVPFDYGGVETFNQIKTGVRSFTTNFGTGAMPGEVAVTGRYTNVEVRNADQYGGAGGAGANRYAVTFSTAGYTLDLDATLNGKPVPLTYFGYWLSALDGNNRVEFLLGNGTTYLFKPADVIAALGPCNGKNLFCGNPLDNPVGMKRRRNTGEQYVFVNFFDQTGSGIERLRFYQSKSGGGYETDNHTVGFFQEVTGNAIPGPAALALFGVGLLGLGLVAHRRAA